MVLYMSLAGAQVPYGDCNQWIYLDFASVSDGLWGRDELWKSFWDWTLGRTHAPSRAGIRRATAQSRPNMTT